MSFPQWPLSVAPLPSASDHIIPLPFVRLRLDTRSDASCSSSDPGEQDRHVRVEPGIDEVTIRSA